MSLVIKKDSFAVFVSPKKNIGERKRETVNIHLCKLGYGRVERLSLV